MSGADQANTFDAVVIGAGHNGLVCANYLARRGMKVMVLERRDVIGGAAVTEEIAPGFRASIFSYLMSLLHPRVIRDFDLKRHGLEILPCSDMISSVSYDDYILFSDDMAKTQASFAKFSTHDAEIYPAFDAYLQEATKIVRKLLFETPVDPVGKSWRGLRESAGLLWRYRRIGRKLYRLVDLLTMSAYDYLREWFEDDRIIAVLAYYASIGTFAGPKSPGSAYVIMHHVMGEHEGAGGWGFVKGGMGAITQALASYGRTVGVQIRTGASVRQISVTGNQAREVITESGDTYRARVVVSNASAKTLYLNMLNAEDVPPDVLREVRGYRTFSTAFKMNIACERPPQYRILDKVRRDAALGNFSYPTYAHIAPDIDYLERAYDDAKHGWYSKEPFMTLVTPTIVDDSLAPPGKHVVNVFGGHAPYTLKGGDWATEKENFKKTVLDTIDNYAPGFSADIIAEQTLVPPDIERIVNLPQGHIFHGELAADQLFFQRPVSGYADYRTPIKGLYICGSSMHPGGGVSGIPGHNAAREILRDVRVRRT
ncbi:NAD(P)/FAD-dependent oxidoreductase [Acidiphilium sp. AL]|uniref:Pyridine nucleotide-disulfide oxidoreductase domain-containing protein 2 n=1 Tax=Acidiphilium iwatense TaxID=768198 RepID=A0ABS9E432_9PROT|nr:MULTISPECIES: NAD(P)/FAD-dependent oxidoreductase [Acidiphilium]MCF3948344.1 NAD(P)/FAD-dependent oxidoreductase [Acidiphilium iwatense]MCU4161285.1 NAD(P)/FAD-dependent oxidoreductase [Acidiphilium sp. AL]